MVNSGSIVVNALLQNLMQPDMSGAEKFDYLNDYIKVKHGICNSKCWMEYPDIDQIMDRDPWRGPMTTS